MTYPHYLHLARKLRPDRLVYLNIDDYRLYWPEVTPPRSGASEHQAVREADLTVCTSALRAEELRRWPSPRPPTVIRHLPHGAPSILDPRRALSRSPRRPPSRYRRACPRPFLGYVGTLEDRVDWSLMARLAETNPIGLDHPGRPGRPGRRRRPGRLDRRRCLASPNVHAIGWRPQGDHRRLQPGVRPRADPLPRRSSVQPRVLPDEGDGLHGRRPPRGLDRPPRMPPLSRPLRRRPARRPSRRPSPTASPRALTTAGPPTAWPSPARIPAGGWPSGSSTGSGDGGRPSPRRAASGFSIRPRRSRRTRRSRRRSSRPDPTPSLAKSPRMLARCGRAVHPGGDHGERRRRLPLGDVLAGRDLGGIGGDPRGEVAVSSAPGPTP